MNASHGHRQSGFTLLEVMLAFVVLAAALGLLLGMLSRGLKQVTDSQAATDATLYAQSLLDELGTLQPMAPGASQGEFEHGRYRWRLQVVPTQDPAPPPPPAAGQSQPQPVPTDASPVLYRVTLDVDWGKAGPTQRLHFQTLRLRSPPGADDQTGGQNPGEAENDAAAAAADRSDR